MQIIFVGALFIFGLIIGSFLNVVIWRLPRGQSLTGRSQCPSCRHDLGPGTLIPLVSFLLQRGQCRYCGAPVSWRYPLIELITGVLFGLVALRGVPTTAFEVVALLRLLFMVAVVIVVFVIDLEHYLILDVVVMPATGIILLSNLALDLLSHQTVAAWNSHTVSGVLAAALASGFFYGLWRISRGRWMGLGDVKFALVLGMSLGLPLIVVGLLAAFLIGSVVGLGLIAFGGKKLSSRIPFGTVLGIGCLIGLFFGQQLWHWYLRLIGWY